MPPQPAFDLSSRQPPALLPELMDEPCSYDDFRMCVRDIAASSRLTLAYAPTLRFLARAAAEHPAQTSLQIVDVGSGGGDALRRIASWALRRQLAVDLTGIDLNPHGTRAAMEFSAAGARFRRIQWMTGDVFTDPRVQTPDVVLSSLVTHHMHDEEIIRFLRWMEQHARRGWFISDLLRSSRSYRLFGLLSRAMRWHPFVQHDGLVSIRRAFREGDWHRLLAAAGIPASAVTLCRCALGRLCLSRLR